MTLFILAYTNQYQQQLTCLFPVMFFGWKLMFQHGGSRSVKLIQHTILI